MKAIDFSEYQTMSDSKIEDGLKFFIEENNKRQDTKFIYEIRRKNLDGKSICCSSCESEKVVKNGVRNKVQRYRCKECNVSFNEFTNTFVERSKKKDSLRQYFKYFKLGLSVRKIARLMDMSKNTAFRYRHLIMVILKKHQTTSLEGVVETDDVYFRLNRKNLNSTSDNWIPWIDGARGVSLNTMAVQFLVDRNGNFHSKLVSRGAINNTQLYYMNEFMDKDNPIYSDSSKAIEKFMVDNDYDHHQINRNQGEYSREGEIHINTLNYLIRRIKGWILYHFDNVSTKYLDRYIAYYNMAVKHKLDYSLLFK